MKTRLPILFLSTILSIQISQAQDWKILNPPPSIFNAKVNTIISDAGGNIYAAGDFKNTQNEWVVVKWTGSYWSEVGQGANALKANNGIISMTKDVNGNLYAAGAFSNSSGKIYVAKWDGYSWSQVGTAFNGFIYTLTSDNNGNLYAGGSFTNAAGKKYAAKWDGSAWTEMGTGTNGLNTNDLIYSIAADNSGKVYAAGYLTNTSNKQYVAVWNGTNWSELGGTNNLQANGFIASLATDNSGNVYAAGDFANAAGNRYVAKWNGASWSELGSINANGPIKTLFNQGTTLYASGQFTNINGIYYVAKWNGTGWSTAFQVPNSNAGITMVNVITSDNTGNIYVGGSFTNSSGYNDVIRWDGSVATDLGRHGSNLRAVNHIYQITNDNNGNVYAIIDDPNLDRMLYKWDGVGWTELGSGESIVSVVVDPSGTVYAGGNFRSLNGFNIAKWTGTTWVKVDNPNQPLNSNSNAITSMVSDQNGNIYAAGSFGPDGVRIVKWNGTGWSYFNRDFYSQVSKMVIDGSGNIYSIGFYFGTNGWYVKKITPNYFGEVRSATSYLDATVGLINDIAVDSSGNLYAGGHFINANHHAYVAKWDGSTWSEVPGLDQYGTNGIYSFATSRNLLFMGGHYSTSWDFIEKWDGTAWAQLSPQYVFANTVPLMSADLSETVYAVGGPLFGPPNNGYVTIVAHGTTIKILEQPDVTAIQTNYCKSSPAVKVKLNNRPDGNRVSYTVKLDANILPVSADSTVSMIFSGLAAGQHRLKIMYSIGADTMDYVQSFNLTDAVSPDVNLSSSVTTVVNLNPFTITATNAMGGGQSPLYVFAKDRTFTNILQAESTSNALTVNPNTLGQGMNRIYVRMKTSETCFTSQTNIDSIDIIVSIITGVVDPTNPEKQITIYPVPVENFLMLKGLKSSKNYTIRIFNSMGIEFYQRNIKNVSELRIDNPVRQSGSYWLTIYDNSDKRYLGTIPFMK